MKIVLNAHDESLFMDFVKISSKQQDGVEFINAKQERVLFNAISSGDVNAFVIDSAFTYSQKAIDFIKKKHPYVVTIVFGDTRDTVDISGADIYVTYVKDHAYFRSVLLKNIETYEKNFATLKRLTSKVREKIEFADCTYDPNNRSLYHNGEEVASFSEKAGGIIEVLASNYGKLVKKELILEKVWLKSDYFSSRSMDVYVTNIRKTFKENEIDINIRNVSKRGLILQ